ncbi:conserved hypothetical protein [Histoplasma capsulatum H143]|uniref:Uncharacterized protein n=1 Tax=Ajellomyces capsulatus (strain H143) TaxID=544712 RepID=C6H7P3_AJECH|nr:conserved hypothetical protein [Histoplasma capsulatum H143]
MPPHIAVIDAGFTESKPNFYTADSESHVPIPPSHKWNSAYPTQAQIKRRSIVLGGMAISSGPLYAKRQSNLLAKTMRVNVSPTTMEPSMESSMALLPPQAFAGILKSSISSPVSVRGQLSTLFENLGGKNSKGKRVIEVGELGTVRPDPRWQSCWLRRNIISVKENDLSFNRRSPDVPKGGPGREILVSCVGLCRSPGRPTISDPGFRRRNIPNWISDELRLSDDRVDRKMDIRNGGMIGKIMEE